MVFSSTLFLFLFLPVTAVGYHLLKTRYQNYWLLAVSLVFFAWSQPDYLWIILLNIAIDYVAGLIVSTGRLRRTTLVLCLAANLWLLIYFKYFGFILRSFDSLFPGSVHLIDIVLPIGISFFTFQGMSYTIDVYRGDVPVQKDPLKLALYIVLFPQLIAGPIVRYTQVVSEIDRRTVDVDDMAYGIQRFVVGLAKKSIVANTMAVVADSIWDHGAGNSIASVAWLGSIAYTLQIYYDFSGYSDMAIGLGRMFGFHFDENFDLPYISKSITEFWRRWHISLSTWFRDYVYIPLGGNRKRVYVNLSIVFLLTGIWHGASWSFVVWGIWNGLFILLERSLSNKRRRGIHSQPASQPASHAAARSILRWCYTILVVDLGWVLFRAGTLSDAIAYIGSMFGIVSVRTGYTAASYLDGWSLTVLAIGILFSIGFPQKMMGAIAARLDRNVVLVVRYASVLLLLLACALRIVSGAYDPFIYFQF